MSILREHFPRPVSLLASCILVVTSVATLGANLSAIAEVVGIFTKTPYAWWVIPLAGILWYIVVFNNYRFIEKYFFFLTFVFLSYIASGVLARPNWNEIITSIFLPKLSFSFLYIVTALGVMGTTVTPFLFFWQSRQEVEENISKEELSQRSAKEDMILAPGFIYSNIISLFIIISTASVLHARGLYNIQSARDAALALEPIAGPHASTLFAIGIIGSGLLAIPILSVSSAYVIAEVFGWRESLSDSVNRAKGFYSVLTASIVMGMGIALSGIRPIQALLYSQVLSGMLAPFLIILILLLCNDKKIMGSFVNGWFDNIFGTLTAVVMTVASVGVIWQFLSG